MSPFAVLAVFAQACLIQSVMSQQQCGCAQTYSPLPQYSLGNAGLSLSTIGVTSQGNDALSSVRAASCGQYGGSGTGQIGVAGDIGVGGNTVVVGSVPVLGAVDFSGIVPASGSVSLSGQCGCGCQ